jgi:hypothetical protein
MIVILVANVRAYAHGPFDKKLFSNNASTQKASGEEIYRSKRDIVPLFERL